MARYKSPVPARLTTQAAVRRWVRRYRELSVTDYTQEHELARGQLIIEKLEAIVRLYGSQNDNSPVCGMALTLLHDPHSIEEDIQCEAKNSSSLDPKL